MLVLKAVAFTTLAERKLLGIVQRQQRPNIVGFGDFLQVFADGLKLFLEETFYLVKLIWGCIFCCCLCPGGCLSSLGVVPYGNLFMDLYLDILYLFFVSSVSVYTVLMSRWVSNSINMCLMGCPGHRTND